MRLADMQTELLTTDHSRIDGPRRWGRDVYPCLSPKMQTRLDLLLDPHLVLAVDIRKQSVRIYLDAHDLGCRRDVCNVTPCAIEPDVPRDVDALHSSVGARHGQLHRHRCKTVILDRYRDA